MIKSHKIKLYPTKTQERFLNQSCGVARFAYNWALNEWNNEVKIGNKPSAYQLVKKLNNIKREQFSWMLNVGKCSPQYAIHNLESAFKSFLKKITKYPKFKKKGVRDSFVAVENSDGFRLENYKLKIPRLGFIKCAENLRFEGKVNNVVIKRKADMWFAVVNVDVPETIKTVSENQTIVGVDLGIKSLAITSNGVYFENPKALLKNLKSLKRKQRILLRKKKGSNNRKKQQIKFARLHLKISNIRNNVLHKATTSIVNSADILVIEDILVSGLLKNGNLSKALGDASFFEFRKQLEYKAKWLGKEVIVADRFFASSKICSNCDCKNEHLKLSHRVFECLNCGNVIDRDLNAAKNLANYGSTLKFKGSNASGVDSSVVAI